MADGWYVHSFSHLSSLLTGNKALERATHSSKSILIGLALVFEKITVEEAALASTVEVSSQIQRWGEVEDCELIFRCSAAAYICW